MGDQDGESFFTRWARLKRQAGEAPRGSQSAEPLDRADGVGDEAETAAVPERGSPGQDAHACGPGDGTPKDADFADVDFDALDHTSDYARFMQPHVPETIRQKALRKLWASDPVLSMPDELNDYMGDYTDAAVAAPGRLLTTAYKVGRGFLDDSEVAAWERLGRPEPAPPAVAVAEGATPPAAPPADESACEPLASSAEESEDASVAPEETGSAPADRAAPGRNQGLGRVPK